MNKKIALSVFFILTIFISASFANFVSADTTIKDLLLSKINNGIIDVSAPQVSTTIVISQVYGAGGNSGATYKFDYVELFNRSGSPVSLDGLVLQYGSATGQFGSSATNIFALPSVTLQPGQHYFVQLGGTGTAGADFPITPDVITTNINLSGASGKIALTNTTTALNCGADATPCTLPDALITDEVSYGAANNAEGGAPANGGTALTSTQGVVRNANGCTDTDNNNNDFSVVTNPVPRNQSSPLTPCGGSGTPTPTATVSFTPTATATATPTPPPCPSLLMAPTTTAIPASTCPATPTATRTATPATTPIVPTPTATPNNTSTTTPTPTPTSPSPRQLRVQSTATYTWLPVVVNLLADALGDETSYNFTLSYDNDVLLTPTVAIGTAGGSLSCNTSVAGQITCSVMNFPNNNPSSSNNQIGEIAAGSDQVLVRVTFTTMTYPVRNPATLTLTNVSASNDAAQSLAITSANGTVMLWVPEFGTPTATPTATPTPQKVLDFDGDGKSDYAVFRPGNNTWFIRQSSNNSFYGVPFGLIDDVKTPGDYDGDRKTDISVWRPSNGTFYVLRSFDNTFQAVQFGANGDEPVARDYNADGRTDFAVVRRTNGLMFWYILTSNTFTFSGAQFGIDTDVVAPGDYDGDRRFDLAVYRGSGSGADRTGQATFFVQRSRAGFQAVQFGLGSDLVVPGDYDGDGQTDFAVVRAGSPYNWFILNSSNFGFRAVQFGTKPFLTTQADYDGDGRTDISVWNPLNGSFYTLRSSDSGMEQVQFGQNGDYPVANFDTH